MRNSIDAATNNALLNITPVRLGCGSWECRCGTNHSIPYKTIDLNVTYPPFAIDFKAKKANYNRTASRVLSGYNEIKVKDYYLSLIHI